MPRAANSKLSIDVDATNYEQIAPAGGFNNNKKDTSIAKRKRASPISKTHKTVATVEKPSTKKTGKRTSATQIPNMKGMENKLNHIVEHLDQVIAFQNKDKSVIEVQRLELETLDSKLTVKENENGSLHLQVGNLQSQLGDISHRHHLASLQIEALFNSRSWKITRSLRAISHGVGLVNRAPRIIGGSVLQSIYKFARKSAFVRNIVKNTLVHFPKLEKKIRDAFGVPLAALHTTQTFMLTPDPASLAEWEKLLRVPLRKRSSRN